MEEIELLDVADDLLIINKTTIDRLFLEEKQNVLILYLFYYKTAKWQKHNPIKANDNYCKKCLHWGSDKLKETKQRLKEMKLITIEKHFDKKHKLEGWYVKVNYLVNESTTPESTTPVSPLVGKQETNTNNNNINTINNINKEIYKESFEYLWNMYPNKKGKASAYKSFIKALKDGVTPKDIEKGIREYTNFIKISKTESQYIKHGSTWFNQRCWEDEYSVKGEDNVEWF